MIRRLRAMTLTALTLFVIGCQNQNSGNTEEVKIPVEVMEVKKGEVRQTLQYNGDIKAEYEVNIFSKIPDRIERYFVDEGDRVEPGTPIVRVVATTIEQAVNQAEAGLAAAEAQEANLKSEYVRAKRLFDEDAMSKQQFEAIETQYEAVSAQVIQAKAAVITAKTQLKDATITSPITGIIGARYFDPGDLANPGMPVAKVVQMDKVEIHIEVTESDLGRLTAGQKAVVKVQSYPDTGFEGKVNKISPIMDPMTRMADVEILIPNPGYKLKPGMYAEVEITTGLLENAIVVPRHAVIENTSLERDMGVERIVKNYFVYVVNDSSRAEQRKLGIDYLNHQYAAVGSGVEIGEKLVVSGQNNLRDGSLVLIAGGKEE